MNWPPMLMHVKVKNRKSDFGIWLPLFLLLPLALVILLIFLPFMLIGVLILLAIGRGYWIWFGLRCLWFGVQSLGAMRGLKVDIQTDNEFIFVTVV